MREILLDESLPVDFLCLGLDRPDGQTVHHRGTSDFSQRRR